MTWRLPTFMRVQLPRGPALWLPLFVLWPVIVSIFVLGFVLALVVPGPTRRMFDCLGSAWRMLCALRGTRVEVRAETADYSVCVY